MISKIYNVREQTAPQGKKYALPRFVQKSVSRFKRETLQELRSFSRSKKRGKWYDAGKERTAEMLKSFGYEIIDEDVGTIPRDVIVHFRKP